ncbi:MAG: hypothetical protein QOG89_3102 [Thermomicrobiales bacterium]|nr:hypothetical protein [Thermomicrobiales bacterium]
MNPQAPGERLRDAVEPLGPHLGRSAFSCGETPLDRHLWQQAGQEVARSWRPSARRSIPRRAALPGTTP